jgi:branched-chain amino acid transport system permease protein
MLDLAVAGLAGGGVYALIGVCLVLSYRVGAVINFSQTFSATLAVFTMTELIDGHGWSLWPAVLVALVIGGLIAGAQGLVMVRLFGDASVLIRSTVTIGMAISFFGLTVRIFHDTLRNFPTMFKGLHVKLGAVTVTGSVIASLVGALGISLAVWLVLGRTRLGVILRAVSGRPTTAELMGVRTTRYVILVWAVAGVLTTAAILLVAPTRRSIPNISFLVVPALAAAVIGSMRSFSLTVAGGLAIGMIESVAQKWAKPDGFSIANYRPGLAFVMVTLALLWTQRRQTWAEER